MDFCHITPTPHAEDFVKARKTHLVLAHLLQDDPDYVEFYKDEMGLFGSTIIVDNSAFELYKAGLPMFNPDALVSLADKISLGNEKCTDRMYIVLPDHPAHPSMVGIDEARRYAPIFKENGYGTFFVPQSDIGDLEDLITSFAWAASSPLIDYIGISILAVPNAYRCEKDNPLQRFMCRWRFMNELYDRGLLQLAKDNGKKIHFLGMVDGPNEIPLLRDFAIDTWDSSAAVWCGLNGVPFDTSPTGLHNGKFETHVDFAFKTEDNAAIELAKSNVQVIDQLVDRFNKVVKVTNV